jgi:phosphatidylethanolamine/phosphatidyl-N-methylethanolamine N-methyltransferase
MAPARYLDDRSYGRQASGGRGRTEGRAAVRQQDFPLQFLTEFAREPFKVGALWPSSKALAQVVADSCNLRAGGTVVELGSGTGAFTRVLWERLKGQGRLVAIEINPRHVAILRKRFPECEVVHGSAEALPDHLGGRQVGCIVSGLAWSTMRAEIQDRIFQATRNSLLPNGQFVAFAYVHSFWMPTATRFRHLMTRHFEHVESSPIVWRNLPPALVYRCWST